MPRPLFGAKDVCYIEKKVGTKKAILGAASLYIVLIYTPKEEHSRIFVTGGSCFAQQMVAKKIASWGGKLVHNIIVSIWNIRSNSNFTMSVDVFLVPPHQPAGLDSP